MLLTTLANQFVAYFESIPAQWTDFSTHLPKYLPIIGLLIIVESLLSVDNAAVLATMVLDLPKEERAKALKLGIIGAYVFRGICLVLASFLVSIWWLKPVGGLYLLYLVFKWLRSRNGAGAQEDGVTEKKRSKLYQATLGALGKFWATVVLVEFMDLAFSLDNVFAAVAYTPNIIAVWLGVFIGILAMRFVAQGFVRLMERFHFLEGCAFAVIAVLGVKLLLSFVTHFYPCGGLALFMEGHDACNKANGIIPEAGRHEWVGGDVLTTVLTLAIFFVPVLTSMLFNFPKHQSGEEHH